MFAGHVASGSEEGNAHHDDGRRYGQRSDEPQDESNDTFMYK